jgi:glutathione S-transferase
MLQIHGLPFSAHTRKVLVTALEKSIPYELVQVIPLMPPPGWLELSPLGLIPAIRDGDCTLADSSVICQYLERRHGAPSLYPAGATQLARALWIEEYVDGGLASHVLRGVLMQRVFAPKFLGQPTDEALVRKSLTEMIPPRLAYLEDALQGDWFAGGAFSIADIAVASILINYHYAAEQIDVRAHPKLHRFLRRALSRDCFRKALEREAPAAADVGGLDLRLLRELGH